MAWQLHLPTNKVGWLQCQHRLALFREEAFSWDPWADPSFRRFLTAIQSHVNLLCVWLWTYVLFFFFFLEEGLWFSSDSWQSAESGVQGTWIHSLLPLFVSWLGETFRLCPHLYGATLKSEWEIWINYKVCKPQATLMGLPLSLLPSLLPLRPASRLISNCSSRLHSRNTSKKPFWMPSLLPLHEVPLSVLHHWSLTTHICPHLLTALVPRWRAPWGQGGWLGCFSCPA